MTVAEKQSLIDEGMKSYNILFEEFNNHGTTVLIATHDLGLISRMKYRSLTLKDGRMSEDPLAEATL